MNLPSLQPRAALALLAFSLSACSATGRPSQPAEPGGQKCAANGLPNSERAVSSTCKIALQTEQVCVYDGEGRLKDIATKRAGLCIGFGQ